MSLNENADNQNYGKKKRLILVFANLHTIISAKRLTNYILSTRSLKCY